MTDVDTPGVPRATAREPRDAGGELLQAVLASVAEGILTVDETQTIVMANPAAEGIFRRPAAEIVGLSLSELMPERFRERHAHDVAGFDGASGHARRMGGRADVVGLRADGEEFLLEASISLATVDGARLYTAIIRDVTEERRREDEVRENRAKLDAALSSMNDAVFISDAEGRFIDFNEAFAVFHRFGGRDECLGTLAEYPDLFEVAFPDGTPAPLDEWAMSRALRGETATGAEFHLRRKDTGERWIGSYSFAPIRDAAGAIIGSVVTCRDVTEDRERQRELAASNQALGRLIAAYDTAQEAERKRVAREIHDDLQQTLAAIKLYLGVVADHLDDPSLVAGPVEEARRLVGEVADSTRRIVNDLRPSLLERAGLIPALEVLAERFTVHTGIASDVVTGAVDVESLPANIVDCLYRVAQEALNNAAKHSQARHVAIELGPSGRPGWLTLAITDDGKGISMDDRAKSQSFGIVGLHERVAAVGGILEIDGAPGEGTRVAVEVCAA